MDTIQTVQLGDATIAVMNVGDMQLDLADALRVSPAEQPTAYADAFARPVPVALNCIYIGLPGRAVLVDAAAYELDSVFALPNYTPPPDLVSQLAAIGVQPAEIDQIVITHAHFDHFNGLTVAQDGTYRPVFPNARVYLGRGDWEKAQREWGDPAARSAHTFRIIHDQGLLYPVDGDLDLGHGVQIIASPGETPGHQSVKVSSQGQTLYCIGDLYHHEVEVEYAEWGVHWADLPKMRVSRAQFVAAALAEDALIAVTHIHGIGSLEQRGDTVGWQRWLS